MLVFGVQICIIKDQTQCYISLKLTFRGERHCTETVKDTQTALQDGLSAERTDHRRT